MLDFTLPTIPTDIVLLVIRVIVGLAFLVGARNKLRNIKKFAKKNGVPVPVGYFTAFAELAGGLGLLTGVLGQWAALGLMLLMLSTISLHIFKWHSPYWASEGGWEYDLMLFAFCSVILVFGVGSYTLLALV